MFKIIKSWLAKILILFGLLFIGSALALIVFIHQIMTETGLDQAVIPLLKTAYLLKENYVEPLDPAKTKQRLISGLVDHLDPHTTYLPPEEVKSFREEMHGGYGGIGLGAKLSNDNKTLVIKDIQATGPAARMGLKIGDRILSIDGEKVEGKTMQVNFKRIRGPIDSVVKLELISANEAKTREVSIPRKDIKIPVAQWALIDSAKGKVFLLRESQFNDETINQTILDIKAAHKESDGKITGIVLDLRDNPGGLVSSAVGLSALFGDLGSVVVSSRDRYPSSEHQWRAIESDWAQSDPPTGDSIEQTRLAAPWLRAAPMVVIVNRRSASASEIVAGALKDWKRATIVGNNTFGKGSIQSIVPLGGDDGAVKITTSRYYTPLGKAIQAMGVSVDIEVKSILDRGLREADLPQHLNGETGKLREIKGANGPDLEISEQNQPLDTKDPQLARELAIENERSSFSPKLNPSKKDAYINSALETLSHPSVTTLKARS